MAGPIPELVSDGDHVQLERLALEVNWRVDAGSAETLPELFTEDGSINTLGEPIVGHDALREWGRMLASAGFATLPLVVGQCTDRYVRTDRGWKVASRDFQPFFMRASAV